MTDSDTKPDKTKISARCTRVMGNFNIVYGTVGLACAALIEFAFPADINVISESMLVTATLASISAIVQGILLRIFGPVAADFVERLAKSLSKWASAKGRRLIASMKAIG